VRKTVAILTSEPPNAFGGVEHAVRELVRGLEARAYEVLVLHRQNAGPAWIRSPRTFFARQCGSFFLSWYLGQRLHDFKDREFAAVISNGEVGWYIPQTSGRAIRKLHIYHGTYRQVAEAIRPFIKYRGYLKLKWWHSMILERASGRGKLVLCNSDQTGDEVHRYFGLHGVTIWLPLNTSHFRPLDQSDCRRRLGIPEHGPLGIFVGDVNPLKGFSIVQSLTRSLPDVRWILALRGNIPADLSRNRAVQVFQNAPYHLLPTLYSAADFAVFPSRYEPFGYVVAEALACGTPVIAAPGGASRLFLQEPPLDSLLMGDAADADRYAAATLEVLNDAQRYRQAVIEKARPRIVETMAQENWWSRFFKVTGL